MSFVKNWKQSTISNLLLKLSIYRWISIYYVARPRKDLYTYEMLNFVALRLLVKESSELEGMVFLVRCNRCLVAWLWKWELSLSESLDIAFKVVLEFSFSAKFQPQGWDRMWTMQLVCQAGVEDCDVNFTKTLCSPSCSYTLKRTVAALCRGKTKWNSNPVYLMKSELEVKYLKSFT